MIPAFASEAEEAEWWYTNREAHGEQMLAAVRCGEAQVLTNEKLRERIAASRRVLAPDGGASNPRIVVGVGPKAS